MPIGKIPFPLVPGTNNSHHSAHRAVLTAVATIRCRQNDNAVIATLSAFFVLLDGGDWRGQYTIPRGLFSFSTILAETPHQFITRLYRMPHSSFLQLSETLALHETRKFRRTGPLIRLSVTLRWLAGGSYLDIAMAYSLPTSTVISHYIDDTIETMDRVLEISFPYRNKTWLRQVEDGFSRACRNVLRMYCGALDGIAIKIAESASWEVSNSSRYFNRKRWCALNTQTMRDSFYRFTFVSCISAGSTHDRIAFSISSLARLLGREQGGC